MFSVIIPVYNCEKTVRQVLDSVRMQTRFDLVEEITCSMMALLTGQERSSKTIFPAIRLCRSDIFSIRIMGFPTPETEASMQQRRNGSPYWMGMMSGWNRN